MNVQADLICTFHKCSKVLYLPTMAQMINATIKKGALVAHVDHFFKNYFSEKVRLGILYESTA